MAGTVTHLAVADHLFEKLGCNYFNDLPLFFSGNIAPDAIHARRNYMREFKKHTHLTEGIHGGDFQSPEKLKIFHERLNEFIRNYYHPEAVDSDLYLGYIVHLVTDELFNIHVRCRFVDAMKIDGVSETDSEFFRRIIHDIESVDRSVMLKYPFLTDVRGLLNSVWDYEIKDMISADELNRSKHWILNNLNNGADIEKTSKYYSYSDAYDFINYTADIIIKRFTEDDRFPRILCLRRE